MSATLITNVSILNGSGSKPFPGQVLVDGKRIKTVAEGAERIDRLPAPRSSTATAER